MKNPFMGKNNTSLYKKVAIWFAVSLSVVSSFMVTLPLLANSAASQFCHDNGGAHVSACIDLLNLIGPGHTSSDIQNLLSDKTFMKNLQQYEQKLSTTPTSTPATNQDTRPLFDTYLFRHGYEVAPTLTPTGGPSTCGPLNKPVTSTESRERVKFFRASVNLTVYSYNLDKSCSYQATWQLSKGLQATGCAYATAYFKDKMSTPITYQLPPSSNSFILNQDQLLYASKLESDTTQFIAKFDGTQTRTVALAPFFMLCDELGDTIVPKSGSTLTVGNATLNFTVLNRQSDPDGWCTATATANTYNCVLDWPNQVSVLKHETSPDFTGQMPYCQPSWLSDTAKRATKKYSYHCGFISDTPADTAVSPPSTVKIS